MGLVLVVPIAGCLTVLGAELRVAWTTLISRCLPASLPIPGLRASRAGEYQHCDETGREGMFGHNFAPIGCAHVSPPSEEPFGGLELGIAMKVSGQTRS